MQETPYIVAAIAAIGALAGVWLSGLPDVSKRIIPFSGVLLVSLSFFWVLPELAERFGAGPSMAMLSISALVILLVDRYLVPICPACSHNHDHATCHTRLHGFETPLIAAALLHGVFDGWTLQLAVGSEGARSLLLGVLIHKVPETLAYGAILNAAFARRWKAYAWAVVLQLSMIAGVWVYKATNAALDERLLGLAVAAGGGMFLYLGSHAVHAEWKRRTSGAHKHAVS